MRMRFSVIPLIGSICLFSCASSSNHPEAAIRQVMADQEAAWDRGDIPGFMDGYADTVCFIGPNSRTCGREAVQARYMQRYPDRASMGDLSFGIDEVVIAGDRNAWLTGTWRLVRAADTLGGGFALFWAHGPDGWRVARDMTY